MKKLFSFNTEEGQTLIEVMTALAAAVVIIAAITSASLNALNNSQFTRDQNTASQYSIAGMEIIRNMRNTSIASLSASYLPDNTYCLASTCTSLNQLQSGCWVPTGATCPQNMGKFVRSVTVVHNSLDCNATPTPTGSPTGYLSSNVKITVTTSWYDSRCTDASNPYCHSAIETSCFSDFTIMSTP